MSELKLFVTAWCPYCKRALLMLQELQYEKPEYTSVDIQIIDEELEPELTRGFDYYYVPTIYMGTAKLHEGVLEKEKLKDILDQALNAKQAYK